MLSVKRIGGGGSGAAGAAAMADYYEGEVRRDLTDRMALARSASKAADEGKPEDGTSTATAGRAEKDEAAAKGAEKTQSGRGHRKSDKE